MSNLNKSLLAHFKPRALSFSLQRRTQQLPSSLLPYASLFLRIQFSRNTLMRCFYFNELVVWWIGILPHPSFFVTETNWNRTQRAGGIQRHPNFSFHRWGARGPGDGGLACPLSRPRAKSQPSCLSIQFHPLRHDRRSLSVLWCKRIGPRLNTYPTRYTNVILP